MGPAVRSRDRLVERAENAPPNGFSTPMGEPDAPPGTRPPGRTHISLRAVLSAHAEELSPGGQQVAAVPVVSRGIAIPYPLPPVGNSSVIRTPKFSAMVITSPLA